MTPTTKSHFLRLSRALRDVMHDAQLGPDVVVGSALVQGSFPGLPRSGLQVDARLQHDKAVGAFVNFVKAHDLLEAIYWLSSGLCAAHRRRAPQDTGNVLYTAFADQALAGRLDNKRCGFYGSKVL